MNQTRLLILVVVAIVAVGGGWYFGTATRPPERAAIAGGKLMFPDLAPKLQDARRIEITSKGKTTVIERKNNVWGVADRGGYRVQETKLRGLLTTLTELRLIEPRTTDPAQFSRLGVEDPTGEKEGTANLLRVLDEKGAPIVSVIVGHRRTRTQGNVPEQVFVRLPKDNQSWLAEGSLQADADPQVWLDRDIINIAHGLITKVAAHKNDQTVELVREGDKLKVTQPAEHPKLEDYKVDDVGRALENLTFQDVKPDKEPIGDKIGESVFSTSDGLDIAVTVYHQDKDSWIRLGVTAPERNKPEAERLNARLNGWAFETGSWKEQALAPSIDDLKAPPPAKPEAAAPEPAPSTVQPAPMSPMPAAPAAADADRTKPGETPQGATPQATAPQDAKPDGTKPEGTKP